MTTFTAPPDQTGLVLNFGDILDVNSGGTATDTTINALGTVNVNGGTATDTTIVTRSGRLFVDHGGIANGTIINGGMEDVGRSGGTANDTIINDGRLFVLNGGTANDTIVNRFGIEHVAGVSNNTTINGGVESVDDGLANNVIFAGSKSILELARPAGLRGTISDWHVGDVIDFLHTSVTSVHENGTNTALIIDYSTKNGLDHIDGTATYLLVGQQADTEFKLVSDGRGGTDLILTPIVGVQHHEAAIHFGPGPHFFF